MKAMTADRDLYSTVPTNLEGLEELARRVECVEGVDLEPLVRGIHRRRQWLQIKREYRALKGRHSATDSIHMLAEKYGKSYDTIHDIIYRR